jgi:hypothetical protein
MNDRFESLASGEVISVQHDTLALSGHRTFRAGELNKAIESHLKSVITNWSEQNNGWFTPEGIDCEALRFGSTGWQKGRIRLCLEFCPDEPNLPAHDTTSSTLPTEVNATTELMGQTTADSMPQVIPETPPDLHDKYSANGAAAIDPLESADLPHPLAVAIPVAGIAAMGTVAVAQIATPVAAATTEMIPHLADTTLELEDDLPDAGTTQESLDEIAIEFGNLDNAPGNMTPNGMMELDLTDLDLDFSEHELLRFEHHGLSDGLDESIDLQDIGKSKNPSMLIDEVWNELNQGNWTGSN